MLKTKELNFFDNKIYDYKFTVLAISLDFSRLKQHYQIDEIVKVQLPVR